MIKWHTDADITNNTKLFYSNFVSVGLTLAACGKDTGADSRGPTIVAWEKCYAAVHTATPFKILSAKSITLICFVFFILQFQT